MAHGIAKHPLCFGRSDGCTLIPPNRACFRSHVGIILLAKIEIIRVSSSKSSFFSWEYVHVMYFIPSVSRAEINLISDLYPLTTKFMFEDRVNEAM